MPPAHRVNTLELELVVEDEGLARALSARLSALRTTRLAPLLDRVFSEHSPPGRVDVLDRLELDLGELPAEGFDDAFIERLGEALRRALPGATAPPPTDRALALLRAFAACGNLPWWADRADTGLVSAQLRQQWQQAPGALWAALRALEVDPAALPRLAAACDEATLRTLAEAASPSLWAVVEAQGGRDPRVLGAMLGVLARGFSGSEAPIELISNLNISTPSPASPDRAERSRAESPPPGRRASPGPVAPAGDAAEAGGATPVAPAPSDSRRRPTEPPRPGTPGTPQPKSETPARPQAAPGPTGDEDPSEEPTSAEPDTPSADTGPTGAKPRAPAALPATPGDETTTPSATPATPSATPATPSATPATPHAERPGAPDRRPALATPPPRPPEQLARARRDALQALEQLSVDDAGLVIVWPFIERLFARLALIDLDRRFTDLPAAVTLLERLANEDPEPREWRLALPKLLCGLSPEQPVLLPRPLTQEQLDEGERMLRALIAHAPILREMSVSELRSSFLRREGLLTTRGGAWLLQVERLPYDLVLDRFPWSWSVIRLPWMPDPMQVEW